MANLIAFIIAKFVGVFYFYGTDIFGTFKHTYSKRLKQVEVWFDSCSSFMH